MKWYQRLFCGLLLSLSVALCYSSSAAASSPGASNPVTRLRGIQTEMKALLVPGPFGWSLIRNVDRYKYLDHQLTRVWYILTWNPYWAIVYVFGPNASAAWAVALCEGGRPVPSPRAKNGQYLGIFQMGSRERATYGHGPDPLAQARAAFRYSQGGRNWGPWECKP